jgi:2-pyrone-4,6-dicarboxylate lactonase
VHLTPKAFTDQPSRPTLTLPEGAWDAHCHVFGPAARFPFAENRSFTPADAPKEALFAMHRTIGVTNSVIVQSGCHGADTAAVEDALAAPDGTARKAIALLPPDADDARIERLAGRGFCGVRFNYMKHLGVGAPIEDVVAFTHRLADFGWHLQIHCAADYLVDFAPILKQSAVPVVIDHLGRVDAALGIDQPAFRVLLALMEDERFWVKVSGCERVSRLGPPYADAAPFARTLVALFPSRTLWGTDWPHPHMDHAIPDDGVLADLLSAIAPSEGERRRLLVDNPTRLYGAPAH